MFKIICNQHGRTTTLKHSGSQREKLFQDRLEAEIMLKQLNQHAAREAVWSLQQTASKTQ